MDLTVVAYLLYLAVTVPIALGVARSLSRNGHIFLVDVFGGDERLAEAVNRLLVVGFCLINVGYVGVFMSSTSTITTTQQLMETLSLKIGGVALVIGLVHFANVWALNLFRRRAILRAQALPPIEPNRWVINPA